MKKFKYLCTLQKLFLNEDGRVYTYESPINHLGVSSNKHSLIKVAEDEIKRVSSYYDMENDFNFTITEEHLHEHYVHDDGYSVYTKRINCAKVGLEFRIHIHKLVNYK